MTISMKQIFLNLLTITVCFTLQINQASAAVIKCQLQEQACNDQGDQYLCRGFGWIATEDFCSAEDVSNRRLRQLPASADSPNDTPAPALTCSEECRLIPDITKAFLCEIYRCGSW